VSNTGKELFEELKARVNKLNEENSPEKKYWDVWKLGCIMKTKQLDLRKSYDDTSREYIDKYREQLIEMREKVFENIDSFVEKCINVMRNTNNFRVYYAETNKEAQKILMDELGDNKIIYKSKSNEAKDIGIIEALKNNDITIKETDLGDVLVQLFDYKLPSFQIGPGAHFQIDEIIAKIKEVHGVALEPTPSAIVDYYRRTYRKELLNEVKISLTSANAISAEEGTIVLGENEGNISLLTRATDKHIVVCGITKIVPSVLDAVLVARIQSRINNVPFAYINLISSPSCSSDIRGINVLGMYGAKEVVIILVDEWRKKAMIENPIYREFLKCINCGSCNYVCTASRAFGNIFASKYGWGAIAIVRDYIHNGVKAAVEDGLFLCTGCENCYHWCPVSVNLGEIMKSIKKEAVKEGLCPPPLKQYQEKILKDKNPF